jgi:hypothetical protein
VKAVLDSGALVAIDERDRRAGAMLRVLCETRIPVWTSAAVVAHVWRDGARQAPLAAALSGVGVRALGPDDGKHVGELQGRARTQDVVDAHVALMVDEGDRVLTSDPDDIGRLLTARGIEAVITRT